MILTVCASVCPMPHKLSDAEPYSQPTSILGLVHGLDLVNRLLPGSAKLASGRPGLVGHDC